MIIRPAEDHDHGPISAVWAPVIRDTTTREQVFAGSVDIRGNTDESWQHGIRYLLNNRLLKE